MPFLIFGALIAGSIGYAAKQANEATRSPVAAVATVAALGFALYLLKKGRA